MNHEQYTLAKYYKFRVEHNILRKNTWVAGVIALFFFNRFSFSNSLPLTTQHLKKGHRSMVTLVKTKPQLLELEFGPSVKVSVGIMTGEDVISGIWHLGGCQHYKEWSSLHDY